jgi:histidinol-phosphatase (PHP family)
MLRELKPEVVGHLDVVRLLSRNPDRSLRQTWPEVWERVLDSLRVVQSYGGMLECNSSALRKGLAEPYPSREIAAEWLATGGRFCLSDDSHGIGQLGTNYARMVAFLEGLGVEDVWTLERTEDGGRVKEKRVLLKDVRACVEKKRWSR